MAEEGASMEQLVEEYEVLKRQYDEMEAAYQAQVKQKMVNPAIVQATKELHDIREACVASSHQRDALLDRILELERSTGTRVLLQTQHKDAAITSRRGTARESRLRARLLPSLNEPLRTDGDPHVTSRHVGPEAVQSRNQRAAQQAVMQYEHPHGATLKAGVDAERAIVKLPKRARPSNNKTGATGGGAASRNAAPAAAGGNTGGGGPPVASVHIFPSEPSYRTGEGEVSSGSGNGMDGGRTYIAAGTTTTTTMGY